MVWSPQVRRVALEGGAGERFVVGHWLVDGFLEFAASQARPNTVRAYAHHLKAFFAVVAKDPVEVRPADVLLFISSQRRPRPGAEKVVRIADGSAGLSAATVRRRLAAVSAFYCYLVTRGDVGVEANPVPRGLPARGPRRAGAASRWCAPCASCPAYWVLKKWGRLCPRCARSGTGPWSRPWP